MQGEMAPLDPSEDLIRKNLIKFREESGLSRAQLAELSGVPEKNIVRYEHGDTGIPAAVLLAIAHVFGRQAGDFYLANPPPPPKPDELPALFFRARPGVAIPDDILEEVREAIDRANQKLRTKKLPKK
jgi:transcriptional regulator with XRE-family HTH domain